MNKYILFIKVLFWYHSVHNKSTCLFSKLFWDVHDYTSKLGGNSIPIHFYNYKCHKCSKEFTI